MGDAEAREEEEFSSADEGAAYDGVPQGRRNQDGDSRDFDDDFDDYGGNDPRGDNGAATRGSGQVSNQPFDEAVELSDDGSEMPSPVNPGSKPVGSAAAGAPSNQSTKAATIQNQPFDEAVELSSEGEVDDEQDTHVPPPQQSSEKPRDTYSSSKANAASNHGEPHGYGRKAAADQRAEQPSPSVSEQEEMQRNVQRNFNPSGARHEEDEDMGGEDSPSGPHSPGAEGGETEPVGEGMYDPVEYAHLGVSQDVKELFQYITRYKPHHIELETKMKPFIADYIPAVGEIDAFVKVPRPDSKPDNLGLTVLDEPCSQQSDPTVFTLQLRAVTKSSGQQPMLVRAVEHAEKHPKQISQWINSINDLHRHKPAPSVRYSKPMPDIEALMQIWPAKFEELLETARLPDAELNVELGDLVKIMCAILDIPVYSSITESLHVLFTLYSDFKANVHFQQQLNEQQVAQAPQPDTV
mmetsp:Transcript_46769/g.77456  ORF Transcript_46769/g.77456 Transcript_46769/m.77456 type:complete len:467 (-) Transcript_46769:218-1618(-)